MFEGPQVLVLYRKGPAPKRDKAQKDRMTLELALRCRVQRPALVAFLTGGGFAALPLTPPAVVKDTVTRILDHGDAGWVIPESDFDIDRFDVDPQSMANSVTAWIAKNVGADFAKVASVVSEPQELRPKVKTRKR